MNMFYAGSTFPSKQLAECNVTEAYDMTGNKYDIKPDGSVFMTEMHPSLKNAGYTISPKGKLVAPKVRA